MLVRGLIDLLFPARCPLCPRAAMEGSSFCRGCAEEVFTDQSLACPGCAATVGPSSHAGDGKCAWCRDAGFAFDGVFRLGTYTGQRRGLVLMLKSASNEWLAQLAAAEWLRRRGEPLRALGVTCVLPVPMHWRRRLGRQGNHACSLARALARGLGTPYRPWWLWRVRDTPQQKGLTREERLRNLSGAFSVWGMPRGERVLLVDDVVTTGVTAHEVAQTLKRAGASCVWVAALARVAEEAVGAGLPKGGVGVDGE
jgi:predicted amidophosphoribosyltransferase